MSLPESHPTLLLSRAGHALVLFLHRDVPLPEAVVHHVLTLVVHEPGGRERIMRGGGGGGRGRKRGRSKEREGEVGRERGCREEIKNKNGRDS